MAPNGHYLGELLAEVGSWLLWGTDVLDTMEMFSSSSADKAVVSAGVTRNGVLSNKLQLTLLAVENCIEAFKVSPLLLAFHFWQ